MTTDPHLSLRRENEAPYPSPRCTHTHTSLFLTLP